MKNILSILIGFICITVLSVEDIKAKTNQSKKLSEKDYQNLILITKKLNFKKTSDRMHGEEVALKLVDQLLLFQNAKYKKENYESDLRNQFELAREAAIFDSESQIAQVLSEQIIKDKDIKLKYEQFILNIPTATDYMMYCKHKYLETVISEQVCYSNNKITATDSTSKKEIRQVESCNAKFDYDSCLLKRVNSSKNIQLVRPK